MKLTLSKVSKIYKASLKQEEVKALEEISLEINSGEKVFIVGESGAGKTTLLNVLSLLDGSYEGNYQINGKDARLLPEREKTVLRNGVFGFMFQEYALIEEDTVLENVGIPLLYSEKLRRRDRRKRIREVLEQVQMQQYASKKVKNLSGGQRQRVALARALVNWPEILVLDEPTGSLNREMSDQIMGCINRYVEENEKTLILVTHDLEKVKKGPGRVIRMQMGRVLLDDSGCA
ncbi:MAG: ABC transporter ATP-binding protein [Lachnospiraceae bacterium]